MCTQDDIFFHIILAISLFVLLFHGHHVVSVNDDADEGKFSYDTGISFSANMHNLDKLLRNRGYNASERNGMRNLYQPVLVSTLNGSISPRTEVWLDYNFDIGQCRDNDRQQLYLGWSNLYWPPASAKWYSSSIARLVHWEMAWLHSNSNSTQQRVVEPVLPPSRLYFNRKTGGRVVMWDVYYCIVA